MELRRTEAEERVSLRLIAVDGEYQPTGEPVVIEDRSHLVAGASDACLNLRVGDAPRRQLHDLQLQLEGMAMTVPGPVALIARHLGTDEAKDILVLGAVVEDFHLVAFQFDSEVLRHPFGIHQVLPEGAGYPHPAKFIYGQGVHLNTLRPAGANLSREAA